MNQNAYGSGSINSAAQQRVQPPVQPRAGTITRFPPQLANLSERLDKALQCMHEELDRICGTEPSPPPTGTPLVAAPEPRTLASQFDGVAERLDRLVNRAEGALSRLQDI